MGLYLKEDISSGLLADSVHTNAPCALYTVYDRVRRQLVGIYWQGIVGTSRIQQLNINPRWFQLPGPKNIAKSICSLQALLQLKEV